MARMGMFQKEAIFMVVTLSIPIIGILIANLFPSIALWISGR